MSWNAVYYFVMVPMVYAAIAILITGIFYKLIIIFISKKFKGSYATFPNILPRPAGVIKDAFLVPVAWKKDKILWFFIIAFHIAFVLLLSVTLN